MKAAQEMHASRLEGGLHRRAGVASLSGSVLAGLLTAIAAGPSHADTAPARVMPPLKCDRVYRPVIATDAAGNRIYGSITVNARIVGGQAEQVDFVAGRPELLQAVKEALLQYSCTNFPMPRVETAVFEFAAPGAMRDRPASAAKGNPLTAMTTVMAPPIPSTVPQGQIADHNAMIRALYPLRTDALLDAEALAGQPYKPFRIVRDVQPSIIAVHMNHVGRWKVKLTYIVNADGSASDFIVDSEAPPAFHGTSISAMRRSTYAPATYGDRAVPTIIERTFDYTIEDDDPAPPAKKASAR